MCYFNHSVYRENFVFFEFYFTCSVVCTDISNILKTAWCPTERCFVIWSVDLQFFVKYPLTLLMLQEK